MTPKTGTGAFQWSAGGWFGSQIGATAYLVLLGIGIVSQAAAPGIIILLCGVAPNLVGYVLWMRRDRISPHAALQWLMLTLFFFTSIAVGTAIIYERSEHLPVFIGASENIWLPLIFPAMMLMFYFRNKKGGSGNFSPPSGPEQILAAFRIADPTLTQETVSIHDDAWRIESFKKRILPLFEFPDPNVEQCMLTYRADLKTQNVKGHVYLEMLCRFPGLGEFFSRDTRHAIQGTNDWATFETPFYLKRGQKPDLIKLNLAVKGRGTVWIKNVRLFQTPLQADQWSLGT